MSAGHGFPCWHLEGLGVIFNLTTKPLRITHAVMIVGEIPMVSYFEEIDAGLS
jgi:hypothetical protein